VNGVREAGSNAPAVAERLALDDDDLPLVAEERSPRQAAQQEHEAEVEHEVPELAQVAALRTDRATARGVVVAPDPEPVGPQVGLGGVQHGRGGQLGGASRVLGQPRQVARGRRRRGADAPGVDRDAGQDAAHQRHHEQQVDRREPR